ncbi:hypothetical protein PEBR_20743 [Penicillium brasilianum]|uniref:Apple domain-containing protein n=1 Tax=Penicillium brasilianum TaxID=104259 RepID=A0A1S9RMB8_PENBI|nr:hypothetical protein PEBR_20743 [Penicillium brasilianum]
MDGIEVVHSHHRPVIDGQGIEVVPDSEKEVSQNNDPIYVSGPNRPGDSAEYDLKNPNKTICGLKPTVFWTLLAIALLVVIGAAVGGGVGGTLANRHTSEPSTTNGSSSSTSSTFLTISTTSTTSTTATTKTASTASSAPVTSGTTGVAANPCPGKNLTTVTGSDGSIFTLLCAVDWPRGEPASSGNGTVKDLTRTTRYTLQSCISDCVDWNKDSSNDSTCKGIIYTANLTAAYDGGQDGNCFLKNSVGVYYPNSNTSMAAGMLGA